MRCGGQARPWWQPEPLLPLPKDVRDWRPTDRRKRGRVACVSDAVSGRIRPSAIPTAALSRAGQPTAALWRAGQFGETAALNTKDTSAGKSISSTRSAADFCLGRPPWTCFERSANSSVARACAWTPWVSLPRRTALRATTFPDAAGERQREGQLHPAVCGGSCRGPSAPCRCLDRVHLDEGLVWGAMGGNVIYVPLSEAGLGD